MTGDMPPKPKPLLSPTTNACNLCAPLGACIALKGIEGAIPLLHGGQGCSTYIRRYVISHFNEPLDVGSSSFSEASAVYGGAGNLKNGLDNIISKYHPQLIGVATTCLAETIGEDVPTILTEYVQQCQGRGSTGNLPLLVPISTPSYRGNHIMGFHEAIVAVVKQLAKGRMKGSHINVFQGLVSPEDIRYMKELIEAFELDYVMLPDYSDTLDGGIWDGYIPLPAGGTRLKHIRTMGRAKTTIQIGMGGTAGSYLETAFDVPCKKLDFPIGVRATDRLIDVLENLAGHAMPWQLKAERSRLIDAYIDGHKYFSHRRAVIYGDEDLVVSMTSFLAEIGVIPVVVATGDKTGMLKERVVKAVEQAAPGISNEVMTLENADFADIEHQVSQGAVPDIIVGNSKGYPMARRLGVPLVRVGFPIHDRLGGQRILHFGYKGTQRLFDSIVNALIEKDQDASPVGYAYM